jgi:nucleoside-diphosphate-sugar epimerase
MRILILGGCGYIGTKLVQRLILNKKNKVIVYDIQWFGNYLKNKKNLKIIKGDIRNIPDKVFKKIDVVVHLANIANDPGVELNNSLSWEVNVLATLDVIEKSIKFKVKKFIFSSSGSVYGIKKEKNVTEKLSLVPISTYNKTKMIAERILFSFKDKINIFSVRPATVCGYSPRMRLDVSVNNLTFQALENNVIKVFGGSQIRPNIHINDLCRIFEHFIYKKKNLKTGVYNAGFENLSIYEIAKKIAKKTKAKIKIIKNTNDPRTYRLNSDKLLKTGFRKNFSVDYAINEIIKIYNEKKIKNNDKFFTVKWMKKLGL